jgi:quinol monooxygenase YgiN
MTKQQVSATDRSEPFDRLFAEVVRRSGKTMMAGFVGPFAERGDVDVLRLILDTGLVDCDKDDMNLLACVQPVLEAAPAARRTEAKALVDEWRTVFEPVDPAKLDATLSTASAKTAQNLIKLGANPNGFATPEQTVTALGRTFSTRDFSAATVMLQALAERDEIPVQAYNVDFKGSNLLSAQIARAEEGKAGDVSYFHAILTWAVGNTKTSVRPRGRPVGIPNGSDVSDHISTMFRSLVAPPSWGRHLGELFREYMGDAQTCASAAHEKVVGEMLLHAEFGNARDLKRAVSSFGDCLINGGHSEIVVGLAKNLVSMGVHPDDVVIDINVTHGVPRSRTLLQAAARRGQRDMVVALLELGADPVLPSNGGAGPNAYELASEHGDPGLMSVMEAWQAKAAVESVLSKHRIGSAPPHS